MLKKLRWRFVWITMAVVLVMLSVIFGLLYSFTKADLEKESYNKLQSVTRTVQAGKMPQDIQTPWFAMQVEPSGYITAIGYTGYDLNDEQFLRELYYAVMHRKVDTGVMDSHELMYRVILDRQNHLIVFLDISGYNASLKSLIQSSILIGSLGLLGFGIASFFLAKWAVRPVEKAWQQQKQFVSDASHELKTPLTVIMSNAELLQAAETTQDQRQRFTQSIMVMGQQMRSLVEGMLELARADNGQVKKSFEDLDFSRLTEDALLPFEPVLFERGMTLESTIEPEIIVSGNAGYLRQVVEILLDNAAKYSDPGVVAVSLSRQGKNSILTVANPGMPIPPEEQTKIFERFYRSDTARTRTGSFGLGLSIANAVVREHGGKIWVKSNSTGNCFFVQIPCI